MTMMISTNNSSEPTKDVFGELRDEIRLVKFPTEQTTDSKKTTPNDNNKFVTVVMPDGKRVKQYKKDHESDMPLTLSFAAKSNKGDVYVREDGKIVRLVKKKDKQRKQKLIDQGMKEELVKLRQAREQRDDDEENNNTLKEMTSCHDEAKAATKEELWKVRLSFAQRAALKGKVAFAKAEYMKQISKKIIHTDLTNMERERMNRMCSNNKNKQRSSNNNSSSPDPDHADADDNDSVVSEDTSITEETILSVDIWDDAEVESDAFSSISLPSEIDEKDDDISVASTTHLVEEDDEDEVVEPEEEEGEEEEEEEEEEKKVVLSSTKTMALQTMEILAKAEYMRQMTTLASDIGNMQAERFRSLGKKH